MNKTKDRKEKWGKGEAEKDAVNRETATAFKRTVSSVSESLWKSWEDTLLLHGLPV